MTSQFDPQSFLDATITEANTKRKPLPAGSDFIAIIGDIKPRAWQGKEDPTKSGVAMDVTLTVDLTAYPDVQKDIGVDKVTLVDGIMLQLTDAGMIDNAPGKNAKLRRYRDALGMNQAGVPFSFRAMTGRTIKVKIKHEAYEGDLYDRVDSVAKG